MSKKEKENVMVLSIGIAKVPKGELKKMKKKKKMNVGGLTQSAMQNGLSRKVNPTTGLTMNKGGMTDYRKKGMFYGGGMMRRGR